MFIYYRDIYLRGGALMQHKYIIEPLLYIEQPLHQKPKVFMQVDYMSNLNETKSHQNKEVSKTESYHRFNSCTIQEKISYLLNMPSEMPRLKCEIVTIDGSKYVGNIVEDEGEYVKVNLHGKLGKQVNKENIQHIRIIGF